MSEPDDSVDEDGVQVGRSDQVDPAPPVIDTRAGDYINENGTWVGGNFPEERQSTHFIEKRDEKQNDHIRRMQRDVLIGIGSLIVLVFMSIVITVSAKWMSEGFARELLQQLLASLLSAAAVVVGYFFGQRN